MSILDDNIDEQFERSFTFLKHNMYSLNGKTDVLFLLYI